MLLVWLTSLRVTHEDFSVLLPLGPGCRLLLLTAVLYPIVRLHDVY